MNIKREYRTTNFVTQNANSEITLVELWKVNDKVMIEESPIVAWHTTICEQSTAVGLWEVYTKIIHPVGVTSEKAEDDSYTIWAIQYRGTYEVPSCRVFHTTAALLEYAATQLKNEHAAMETV